MGHGATATVWAARAKATGEFVAVKMFYLAHLKGDKVQCTPLHVRAACELAFRAVMVCVRIFRDQAT